MYKIGLDAGHGLKTAGKQTPDGIKEWTLNDKVRDKIVNYLKDYDVEFLFTDNDEGNVDEALKTRRSTYLNAKVDLFISTHHNAFNGKWNEATGVEVWVDKNCTAEDMKLAELIYKNLPKYTGLKGRGIKKEDWLVINQNKITAVLVEGGFMDSKIDYPVITSDKGQDGYARAVAEGIIEFLGLTKKESKKEEPVENKAVLSWQKTMNSVYHCGLAEDNSFGPDSEKKANKYYLTYKLFGTIKNDYVRFVQERLNYYGFKCDADGSYGPKTKKTVIDFQKSRGLLADGKVGPKTIKKLLGL